jgi:hypothetical protein
MLSPSLSVAGSTTLLRVTLYFSPDDSPVSVVLVPTARN